MAKKAGRDARGGHLGAAALWLIIGLVGWRFAGSFLGSHQPLGLFLVVLWLWVMLSLIWDALVDAKRRVRQAQAASARRQAEEHSRKESQQRQAALGPRYASIVESTLAAVKYEIGASEAARAGLLGDTDFGTDIKGISENFRKAYELQEVAWKLRALDNPSADDRRILAEANATVARLESAALKRVELIAKCATEAQLIDKSLNDEREELKTAEQRAELHARLSGMLYGIEATPDTTPGVSAAADAVLARVWAYREITKQIQQVSDE
ncbi:MAG: hypothetical protein R2763_01285 [Mycobacterium sp.]